MVVSTQTATGTLTLRASTGSLETLHRFALDATHLDFFDAASGEAIVEGLCRAIAEVPYPESSGDADRVRVEAPD